MKAVVWNPIRSILLFCLLAGASCTGSGDHAVNYRITGSSSGYYLRYLDKDNNLVYDTISSASAEDAWIYGFDASEGQMVFLSANYKDVTSALRVQVLIDGKVYKQAYSKNDTISILTVSGTVPYSD